MKISNLSTRAMRGCRAALWASVTVWALLAAAAQGQDVETSAPADGSQRQAAAEPAAPDDAALAARDAAFDAQLEQAGATIRAINVAVDNVFDPSNPKEDKPLYRWANKVHFPTHDSVIESALLFDVGDRYSRRVLDESARALRGRGYIADVKIGPGGYDAVANTVAVDVRVRDAWTLAPELKYSHKGGASEWAIGIDDRNLFGTGK